MWQITRDIILRLCCTLNGCSWNNFPWNAWVIFCFFFSQDVFGDLWLGGRQAVDHLEADLIWDLVLDPGFIAHIQLYFFCTSNCISYAHPTVFLSAFQLVCFWCCIAMCIVACFRLFYCSLTRWGFHTPVKQMVMTIVMMRTGEKLVWVWVWVGNSKLVIMENIIWWFLPEMLMLLQQQQTDKGNCNMILIDLQSSKADTQLGKI